ncbi:MAG: hypothetical protein COW67_05625 [Flavobacteriales bacterium CG18_big_fil_WC_8_21_14_2_50_32_9]|nr:hypothetical protein [Flavobacteriales bacterium]PIQ15954.1 MAG: hypothetical protein COW67_05625 [Flavobacteriales bacterium CG18_big_fil_WC_8_21_14_2_50_32_9]PJC61571.1 MAG: hypothetical protein CO022_09125 [Flavobacteriales bacterium CG_4_9_14_0_2_um_filter_32_27]
MKKFAMLFCTALSVCCAYSQINFTGYLTDEKNDKLKDVTINVYDQNELISTEIVSKKFSYDLSVNTYYTLELVKDGFFTKRIAISTFGAKNSTEPFLFAVEMLMKQQGKDNLDTDFPSALIEYQKNKQCFSYNASYAKNIKKEQEEVLVNQNK